MKCSPSVCENGHELVVVLSPSRDFRFVFQRCWSTRTSPWSPERRWRWASSWTGSPPTSTASWSPTWREDKFKTDFIKEAYLFVRLLIFYHISILRKEIEIFIHAERVQFRYKLNSPIPGHRHQGARGDPHPQRVSLKPREILELIIAATN